MDGQTRGISSAVNGLVVFSITGDNPILLPKYFTRDDVPVGRPQISKPDVMPRWTHLREANNSMPVYFPDVLLIGSVVLKLCNLSR